MVSRRNTRRMFGGDIFPVFEGSEEYHELMEFFQTERGGRRKGIVEIEL
jgi:hypothetical protein